MYEGWLTSWENKDHGLPKGDIKWLKHDPEKGLFKKAEKYVKHTRRRRKTVRKRRRLKDRMWFDPPEIPGLIKNDLLNIDSFFHTSVFFWRPVGVWGYSIKCPRKNCPAANKKNVYLYKCGYSKTVRYVVDLSRFYCMLTEVLACNECRKASKNSSDHRISRFQAWGSNIISQLAPCHQQMFPAILTPK